MMKQVTHSRSSRKEGRPTTQLHLLVVLAIISISYNLHINRHTTQRLLTELFRICIGCTALSTRRLAIGRLQPVSNTALAHHTRHCFSWYLHSGDDNAATDRWLLLLRRCQRNANNYHVSVLQLCYIAVLIESHVDTVQRCHNSCDRSVGQSEVRAHSLTQTVDCLITIDNRHLFGFGLDFLLDAHQGSM
jgi:hypothetical protein